MIATLNWQLSSFRVKSRAKIWHHMRQNVPLPPPIKRDGFHNLREEKSKAKVWKKSAFSPVSIFSSLHHLFFLFFPHASATTNHAPIFPAIVCLRPSMVVLPLTPVSPLPNLVITWFFMQWLDNCMVDGPGQQPCGSGLDLAQKIRLSQQPCGSALDLAQKIRSGPAQPKKKARSVGLLISPTRSGWLRPSWQH